MSAPPTGTRRRPRLQNDPIRPARLPAWERVLIGALALLVLFGPALGYLAGKRPQAFENHALAPFPSLSSGWGFFGGFNSWATDSLIGRKRAVMADREIELRLFHEEPPPAWEDWAVSGIPQQEGGATGELAELRQVPDTAVLQGQQGVLFFWQDFQYACLGVNPATRGLTPEINELQAAMHASGRRLLYTIAPDKSTVESRLLPARFLGSDCSAAAKARLWHLMATNPPSGYVPLLPGLERADTGPDRAYITAGTHWNGVGDMVYAQQLVQAIDPAALGDTTWRTEKRGFPSDLAALMGGPGEESGVDMLPERTGVTTDTSPLVTTKIHPHVAGYSGAYPLQSWSSRSTSTAAPLIQPRVLILGDSFTALSKAQLAPFFRDVTFLHLDAMALDPAAVVAAVKSAQIVVVERVERWLNGEGLLMAPGLANEIGELPPPTA